MTQNANETPSKIGRANHGPSFPLHGKPLVGHALYAPASLSANAIFLVQLPVNRVQLFVLMAILFTANCPANYWGYNGIVQNQTYQLEFTPRVVQNTTYWATMSVGSIGGYGGIQQWNSPDPTTDHGGLYSIWDSTSTNMDSFVFGYNPFITFNNYTFRFGGEGTGAQLGFKWAWLLNKPYRMAWRRYVEPSNTMARYEGFYFDPYDTNAVGWIWVGTVRKPVNTDSMRNMQGFEGFSEAYGGNTSQVREIDIRNVWLLDLNNQWLNIANANMLDSRDQAVLTPINGGWRHRDYDTNDVFSAVDNLSMLPANDLSAIYLPYHINCGWGSTNVATSAQVAVSLSRAFEPDAFWYGVSATNYTASAINVSGVANAAPSLLYQSRREGTNFGYKLFGQQPNAPCLVRLHFAETDFNSLGTRVQTVLINGTVVESNLDIRASAGAQNRALVRDYVVNIGTNGFVDIALQSQTANVPAVLSGIEASGLRPQLAWHPQSVTNLLGTTAQFSATAVGPPPLGYQWQKNASNLVGQTNSTLSLFSVTTNDTANYLVVVSNAYGTLTSTTASLWVAALTPTITSQPQSQSVPLGSNVSYSVTATGIARLAYQWFFNTNTILTSATNATLTIKNIQTNNAGGYLVVVTNALGSATSSVATLKVMLPIAGLFPTGAGGNGAVLPDNSIDPHYMLVVNPDSSSSNAIVESSTLYPIVSGPWLANDNVSKWIGPRLDSSGSAAGDYVYRVMFSLSGFDPFAAVLQGQWSTDDAGVGIFLNGIYTGISQPGNYDHLISFTITNYFNSATNKLEFKVHNDGGPTGLRIASLSASATPRANPEPPRILAETVRYSISGGTTFFLTGEPGRVTEVQVTSTMTNWVTLGWVTNINYGYLFTDAATNLPRRFYRARYLP